MTTLGTLRPLVAANWKMNGLRREGIDRARTLAGLAREHGDVACDVVVCPPATLLVDLRAALDGSGIDLGAQDCHAAPSGPHTGDIGAPMLADVGCRFVILGHSERRAAHGETDEMICAKARAALAAGLAPIVCVGESDAARDEGETVDVVRRQLEGSLDFELAGQRLAVAYEPIWAIGTGRTATPDEILEVHALIHGFCDTRFSGGTTRPRVLYGGSVNARNAAELLALDGVDGALVGGASLDAAAFWTICEAAGARLEAV